MSFTPAELHRLNYIVQLAETTIAPGRPTAKHLPDLRARIEAELATVSSTRNRTCCSAGQLEVTTENLINSAEAANMLGCSQRRIQQRIRNGELQAVTVSGRYLLHRKDIANG